MQKKRVVITGLGLLTPIGTGLEKFWNAAIACTDGIRPLTAIDTRDFKTKTGGEVADFIAADFLTPQQIHAMGKTSQFAVAAVTMALADAGLDLGRENRSRVGVCVGTTMGEPQVLERAVAVKYSSSANDIPADLPRQYPCNAIPANIARAFDLKGPAVIIPTACAAGNYAMGYAFDLIRLGRIDCAVTGGSDSFSKIAFTGFNRLLATADYHCKPFSRNRNGMAVSEGAGILVVESLEHALARGARIYAEVLGYGLACDAFKMTIPDPCGSGGIRCLKLALKHSQIGADEVDYISAHGTGTVENDKTETFIIKEVFGPRAKKVPVSSIKSMIGHTMGAASSIEAIASVLMIRNNMLLPTINYEEPDPDCDLDYVPNAPRAAKIDTVVSNAYAFGGNTSTIILRRYKG
jgi:3-oxoacyl-[acyl-carrier-protein] synthase II